MRLTKLISWMLLCGSLAFFAASAHGQSTRVAGRIIAAKVTGTVTATNLVDNSQRQLATNDTVTQQTLVTTGAGSSVILVFSNGASLNLGADSAMSIDEFLQDPFASEIAVADLKAEPTSSTTKVNLTRGELVGNVKKLNQDAGSSFTVNTPVGAAGIRGTTFRIVFRPDASGRVFFTLSTAEGAVLFEAPAAAGVTVETGKEVVVNVEVTVDATTGAVTLTSPPEVQGVTDISAETQAVIATAAQDIVQASAEVIVQSVTNASNPPSESRQDGNDGDDEDGPDDQSPPADPVIVPTRPTRTTTPGDGQTT